MVCAQGPRGWFVPRAHGDGLYIGNSPGGSNVRMKELIWMFVNNYI